MSDNNIQDDTHKLPRRPDILRAKDIIPGANRPASAEQNVGKIDIPRFDLAEDIMAEQRRLTAVRRKGPSTEDTRHKIEDIRPSAFVSSASFSQSYTSQWDPIIVSIVAKDIERLCGGK